MQLTLQKTRFGFIPADDDSAKAASKIPQRPHRRFRKGRIEDSGRRDVHAQLEKKVRNPAHHRLRFGWVSDIFDAIEHLEMFTDSEALRAYLTLRTEFVTTLVDPITGEVFRTPRSWSYDSMDENDFSKMVGQIMPHLCGDFASICQLKGNWSDRELQGFIAMVSV